MTLPVNKICNYFEQNSKSDRLLAAHTAVTMIGNGCTRGASVSYNSEWVLNGAPTAHTGYLWGSAAKNWGTNKVGGTVSDTVGYGYGAAMLYETDFSTGAAATASEAQAAVYDSGGGVFAKVGGGWRLAGIMVTVGAGSVLVAPAGQPNQPSGVAIYGNATYAMELSAYRPQIEAVRALSAGYDIWQYLHFRGPATDASADPDGDGFTNIEEYAYGLDPQVKDSATAAPQITLASYGDGSSLTATFTRNRLATDVALLVEVSADLITWTSGSGVIETVSTTALGNEVERLVVRDLATTAGGGRRFLRVRVTR
jgi:hypothetical protein